MKNRSNVVKTQSQGRGMKHSLNAVLAVVVCIVLASISAYAAQQQVPVPKEHKSQNPTVKPDTITPMTNIQQGAIEVAIPQVLQNPLLLTILPSRCEQLKQAGSAINTKHQAFKDFMQQKNCNASEGSCEYKQNVSLHNSLYNNCCAQDKSFSVQDQQAAGCQPSESVAACQDKLIKHCLTTHPSKATLLHNYATKNSFYMGLSSKSNDVGEAISTYLSILNKP